MEGQRKGGENARKLCAFSCKILLIFPPVCPSLKPKKEDALKYLKYVLQTPEKERNQIEGFF